MSQTKLVTPVFHNLFSREIRPIRSWSEWLERWQAAVTLEEMLGLIHVGFGVSYDTYRDETQYDQSDRLAFYFRIADGWADHYHLLRVTGENEVEYVVGRDKNGNMIRKSPSELRQRVARKAFDMLCLNFFKLDLHQDRDESTDRWMIDVVFGQLFLIIQGFFRLEKHEGVVFGDRFKIRNLQGFADDWSPNEKHVVDFFIALAKFVWRWKDDGKSLWIESYRIIRFEENVAEMRSRLIVAKLWILEVLSQMDMLDILDKWLLEFDKDCLAKLEEIALRSELKDHRDPVSKDRKVNSVEEACYADSSAAWMLQKYKLMKNEDERLKAILDAQRNKEEADQELKRLTSAKK